jgi:hypothetical protein
MRQKPTELEQETPAQPQEQTPKAQPFKCKCGDPKCWNEWHRLAMWLAEEPATNYGRLLACVEEHIAGAAAKDMETD